MALGHSPAAVSIKECDSLNITVNLFDDLAACQDLASSGATFIATEAMHRTSQDDFPAKFSIMLPFGRSVITQHDNSSEAHGSP
jgi:hypothetical protein